ncbi:Glutamate-gated chloride channel [Araneus ventricosus]|uniref:Glutamate-gated chloride channel n=1 Tax=Araneus ventricosus TaxID=182803 RepID=A0A4Y2AZ40_ARAVE|nr:Glutamate-gated chloride channel [Araneus ventricosus]
MEISARTYLLILLCSGVLSFVPLHNFYKRLKYPSFQKPLVHHHGDLHAEKMRQCEVHMKSPKENLCRRWMNRFPSRSKRIDVISRISFPLMFALFNLVYWTTYLFREDKEE